MAVIRYICENCGFVFERISEISECPDCGTAKIRIVTEEKEEAERLGEERNPN
jgi:putative FmdB family regulatory protein